MTAKAPTPIPEGMNRLNRLKDPSAPPKLNNVVALPTKKFSIGEIKVRIDMDVLEDGSIWYRVENIKTGVFGEWIKNGG